MMAMNIYVISVESLSQTNELQHINKNNTMKISITTEHGFSYTYEGEDRGLDETIEIMHNLLICAGYHPQSVSEAMSELMENKAKSYKGYKD